MRSFMILVPVLFAGCFPVLAGSSGEAHAGSHDGLGTVGFGSGAGPCCRELSQGAVATATRGAVGEAREFLEERD